MLSFISSAAVFKNKLPQFMKYAKSDFYLQVPVGNNIKNVCLPVGSNRYSY